MAPPVAVAILEELLPRQLAAALHDAREARVGDGDGVLDAALAAEAEAQHLAVDLEMPPAQRGEAVGAVLAHVFVVADADQRLVEETHYRSEDLAAAQVRVGNDEYVRENRSY